MKYELLSYDSLQNVSKYCNDKQPRDWYHQLILDAWSKISTHKMSAFRHIRGAKMLFSRTAAYNSDTLSNFYGFAFLKAEFKYFQGLLKQVCNCASHIHSCILQWWSR